ncbi:endoglucanase [Salmonella enterica subsp. salamae]|uniref:cellulase n=1 Tax=Salmonella enterica subsp. salamae TaxID=59202 RepID=A0A6D2G338_SALER|nr:endoglucanase [Salmonella enterica subsp. salamae]
MCRGWAQCCYLAKSALPRRIAGVLTQAICRRSWRNTLAALARRGRRYGKPICGFCWKTAPKGFSPDWVRYKSKQGWQLKAEKTLISSYDAIRVYLWAGMMHDGDPQKARLLARFKPDGDVNHKKRRSTGESGCRQRERSRDGAGRVFRRLTAFPAKSRCSGRAATAGSQTIFLAAMPITTMCWSLFGQGWDQHRFRFTVKGELLPDWGQECVSSR